MSNIIAGEIVYRFRIVDTCLSPAGRGGLAMMILMIVAISVTSAKPPSEPFSEAMDTPVAHVASGAPGILRLGDPDAAHAEVYRVNLYPSATECATCHPNHYRQWSVSQHAYAQLSPVFNAMQGTVVKLTNGTTGDFCIRCHTPVGMALGEPVFISNLDRSPISREGVTCIVCHRVNRAYGKVNARFAIAEGDITGPIYGPDGDTTSIEGFMDKGLVTGDPNEPGRKIHNVTGRFFEISTAASCGMCHDVTLASGLREIEAFSEYRSSPAAKRGVTCQDCHMGREQGHYTGNPATNYEFGPAARIGREKTPPRKLTNHMTVGPDFSLVHPALFPHTATAIKTDANDVDGLATIEEWLQFDWAAGWGTDDFEDTVEDDQPFPERWSTIDDRYDAREVLDDNFELLDQAREARLTLLRHGYILGDIVVRETGDRRMRFRVQVRSGTDGHAVPTGLDAERPVWLHVTVKDAAGRTVLESGDLDPNGDVRDLQSAYVRNGERPLDPQLFNLQSKFITRNLRGGEREQVLPVPHSATPLPFVRPSRRSSILLGRSGNVRKHKMSIEPLGERWAEYTVQGEGLDARGPYQVTVELKAAMVPVSLVNEIKGVGFDYGMTPRQIADAVVREHVVIARREMTIKHTSATGGS